MRTTILFSTLLLLAGYAPAQDSPITVGDSGPIQGRSKGPSYYVKHKQFQYQNHFFFVSDQDYKVACFQTSTGKVEPLAQKHWILTLNDGTTLESKDGSRIDIDYHGKPVVLHTVPNGDQSHEVVGDPLKSGMLWIDGGTTTAYPTNSPSSLVIHYCLKGDCKNPDPCNPPPPK